MRSLIASDIHGSRYYCDKLLEAYEKENAKMLVLLGDILYHGPRNDLPKDYNPKAVATALNKYKDAILCVRGNCDAEVDQMMLDFSVLSDMAVICDDKVRMYLTHGHVYNADKPPVMAKGSVLLSGHTHVPVCEERDGFIAMNPGSVSIPKSNTKHSYMVYENGVFEWKELDGETYMKYEYR